MGWRVRVGMKVMGWDGLFCPSDSAQNPGDSGELGPAGHGKDKVTQPITAHFLSKSGLFGMWNLWNERHWSSSSQ